MKTRKRRPQITFTIDPTLLTKLEEGIKVASASTGRKISVSEALNNILADHFKIVRSELLSFRQRNLKTKVMSRTVPANIEALFAVYTLASPPERQILLASPVNGDILKALYTDITGKDL